jgi:asparagine synthetase B (glutamine-hydrolysing)
MCGICGIHRFGDAPIDKTMVDILILQNQNRGMEAAGIALQQEDGTINVLKNDVTPYQFIADPDYKQFMEEHLRETTVTVLGHTRKATKGDPKINNNNHPMFAGESAIVHNGVIHNDDQLFTEFKLKRKAATDSDIIRAVVDAQGLTRKTVDMMSRATGNAAFAAIHPNAPGKLLLGRSGNPIELAATANHLIFSSERGPLYKALRPFKQVYGIIMREMTPIDYYMIPMHDHSAWLFSDKPRGGIRSWEDDWLEWTQEMKIAYQFTPHNYQCHAQYHGTRIRFYDAKPLDAIECPNCGLYLAVTPAIASNLKGKHCGFCKQPLIKEK